MLQTYPLLLENKSLQNIIYFMIGFMFIAFFLGVLSSCTVVKTNFSNEAKKDATVYYYLPESILKIRANVKVAVIYSADDSTLTESSRIIEQSFTTATEMIADTKDLLTLNYKSNAVMSDEIKYGVNSKGLLETVNISTDDRTSSIISKLAEAPQIILGLTSGASKSSNTIVKIKEYSSDYSIKVSKISKNPTNVSWIINIANELGKDEFTQIDASFIINSKDDVDKNEHLSKLVGDSTIPEINGILTRPLKNIEVDIKSHLKELNSSLPINLVVADNKKLIVIPVSRTAFVKRVNKIGIQDGIITSNEINNPSSVEGFISIPINIAKAIVSIPGQLIQFKYDNTKRVDELEKAKLDYEKTIQDSQKFALQKEQEIAKVKLDIEKNDLSNQIEIQKTKLELQKTLIDLETKLLESQKALDAIKKEIEANKKGK